MKKQDFISELMSYGTAFALGFLVIIGMSIVFAVFLCVIAIAAFFDRLFN